jgi:hypothetical protein
MENGGSLHKDEDAVSILQKSKQGATTVSKALTMATAAELQGISTLLTIRKMRLYAGMQPRCPMPISVSVSHSKILNVPK